MQEDVTDQFMDCLKAEKKDLNVLILRKLTHKRKRIDGIFATLSLEHRWLSQHDVHCVLGQDHTLWTEEEIGDWNQQSLFEMFQLF